MDLNSPDPVRDELFSYVKAQQYGHNTLLVRMVSTVESNYIQHPPGGVHLQREVEAGKWIHLIIYGGSGSEIKIGRGGARTVKKDDWNKPSRRIELHCEKGWLEPASPEHGKDFLNEKIH